MLDFLNAAAEIRGEIVALRRAIHECPELGTEEEKTAQKIESCLRSLGIETKRCYKTGVVGLLRGARPGPTVAFRADIDALPIEEKTNAAYASKNAGVMHACGHDAHAAALLGTAKLLANAREHLDGNIKFLFQPDEEGNGGAAKMVAEGCMRDPDVNAVFGAHVSPSLPAGIVGVMPGKAYAASNMFWITVKGKGSHGARPHEGVDAIAIGAQIVSALQQYVSRQTDPLDSAVVSVGTFHSSGAPNAIADEVKMRGIIRTLGPEMRAKTVEAVRRIVTGTGEAMGALVEIEIREGHAGIVNDPGMTDFVAEAVSELLGPDKLTRIDKPSMGTEDFGVFLEHAPGTFYSFGTANEGKGINAPLHNSTFDVDEDSLHILSALHAAIAYRYFQKYKK